MRRNPYHVSAADALRARIEQAAGVTISLRHFTDHDDCGPGWWGWAQKDGDYRERGNSMSNTVASETADSEIAVLDRVAKALGINDADAWYSGPQLEEIERLDRAALAKAGA